MAGTGTTRDRVWGSVTNERDEDSIMKTTVSFPGGRKPQGFSNPQLVAMRRDYFRRLAKAKLLNTPDAPAVEAYLKRLDEELARRKITIQNPELT